MAQDQKITVDVVKRVAELGRLNLTEAEVERLTTQLGGILETVSVLNQVDTEGVLPTRQVTGLTNQFEADEVKEFVADKKQLLDLSSGEIVDDQIVVPAVF
jgi:aspartyl-tRNA(Asn)/glutamyl-tRNA(Gln) amidotransferase subunit C